MRFELIFMLYEVRVQFHSSACENESFPDIYWKKFENILLIRVKEQQTDKERQSNL